MTIETVCDMAWQYHPDQMRARREDIESIVAEESTPGDGGFAEEDVVGIYLLKDGRYLYVSGGCDTTGWDCQSSASSEIRHTLDEIIRECCTEDDRQRLGLELPK